VTYVPVRPSHRSGPADRDALRALLGTRWDQYAGAVSRALTRMPGLRNDGDADALTADLVAVHSYLVDEQGLLSHRRLGEQLALGQADALPFVSCVASGLRRLPSYRGAAVRSAGVLRGLAGQLLPGEELGEAAPVSAVILDKESPSAPADHYVIWSATGRRPGSLADSRAGTGHEEVLFGPGTRFRVLQVREQAGTTVVLLRELAETAPQAVPGRLDDSDAAVLTRLLTAAGQPTLPSAGQGWPDRCAGTLGTLVPESG
jgi:hypothetical protein